MENDLGINTKINENKELSIWEALLPVFGLIALLGYNVYIFGDSALSGSNQFALLLGAAIAAIVGFRNKVSYASMMDAVSDNLRSTGSAILILLMVGSLSAAWMISGIIPSMVYYGLQIMNPTIFFPATVIICCIISLATGSSWTTSATVGVALIGIGKALGLPVGMIAGAVISGAYFGDKLSPLSDTTNLAPAMAGTDLFTHIRYMMLTTVPTIIITLIFFTILGLTTQTTGVTDSSAMLGSIDSAFNITPLLFLVPAVVIFMIVRKTEPLIALLVGTLLGCLFAVIFQPAVLKQLGEVSSIDFATGYKTIIRSITEGASIATENETLSDLFNAKGMAGMLPTIWLIICAMVFGGVMEGIGALARISSALLSMAKSVFGLFASTVASCLALNLTASDQYLAIVVPGKMFQKAYKDKGLAPENLSRTLEDSGTVTSALVPWNTCGAYQAGVLGVSTLDYAAYAIFNYLSPFVTLIYAAVGLKIKTLSEAKNSTAQ